MGPAIDLWSCFKVDFVSVFRPSKIYIMAEIVVRVHDAVNESNESLASTFSLSSRLKPVLKGYLQIGPVQLVK